ncbi:MAG: hypothetical protein H6707_04535 [Deltaproteobacteria bacterium]|nr:hypothetical protein [Deltaproteobacteria bacterium]
MTINILRPTKLLFVAALCLLGGCSDSKAPANDAAAADQRITDATLPSDSIAVDALKTLTCPDQVPQAGTACDGKALCSYAGPANKDGKCPLAACQGSGSTWNLLYTFSCDQPCQPACDNGQVCLSVTTGQVTNSCKPSPCPTAGLAEKCACTLCPAETNHCNVLPGRVSCDNVAPNG